MSIYNILYDLFFEGFLMSTQMRIIMTTSIVLNLVYPHKFFIEIIKVFYPILILSFWVPTIGLTLHYLNIRESHKEVINKTNLTKYSYKILLLLYVLCFLDIRVTKKSLLTTLIYISLYSVAFDAKDIYQMNFKESFGLIILTLITIIIIQKIKEHF